MRLIENSTTREIFSILSEDTPINYEDKKERLISTGLTDDKARDIINAVVGQMSDGMWENSPGMERYWKFASGLDNKGNIVVYDGYERRDQYNGIDRYGVKKYKPHWSYSAFSKMDDTAVKRFFAHKIKQIVKEEGLEWNRNNTELCSYLNYNSGVTVRDAYRVYDRLLGRIDRIKESVEITEESAFRETVLKDFQLFIEDKYDLDNIQAICDQLEHVTEEDVNDYFTGMFYDIIDSDDLDSANEAERIIRAEYGLTDNITESDEILKNINSKFKEITGKNMSNSDIYLNHEDKYYSLCSKKRNLDVWTKKEDNPYIKALKNIGAKNIRTNNLGNFQFTLNESSKPEDGEKRVIMQQGNVTCFKDGDKFLVFENEKDNEVSYNSQDKAMVDFCNRIGIDTNRELKETE